MNLVKKALARHVGDETVTRQFLSVWPVAESILESFSQATRLPIFVYLNGVRIFQTSMSTMPPFCAAMLTNDWSSPECARDGVRRASLRTYDEKGPLQYCHAGMLNGRCEVQADYVGTLVILYGSRRHDSLRAIQKRSDFFSRVAKHNQGLAEAFKEANDSDDQIGIIAESDINLMEAIADILKRLIIATVAFRSLAMNMAHELSLIMLGLGLLAEELNHDAQRDKGNLNPENKETNSYPFSTSESTSARALILSQSRLGLYIVRNFLSHTAGAKYEKLVRRRITEFLLDNVVQELVQLYQSHATEKGVRFEVENLADLPPIRACRMEISRLFHNIFSNAVKYSYHSTNDSSRVIRVSVKNPYDPGFGRRRFAVVVENYGLGVTEEERRKVTIPGFRGQQALAEVPIGAGIGLSEALKILKATGGELKFRSRELHQGVRGESTYLTSVELIFPY